jgi:5-hydroxyisourate hydrolase-like protein (transthyretin family)/uncharacterized protein (DUF2141 family)
MLGAFIALALFAFQGLQPQESGSIEGSVVRFGTSAPIAGARVSVGGVGVVTDDAGRFEFRNLQPGRYRIVALHPDYTPPLVKDRGTGQLSDITVVPGQSVRNVVVALVPMSAISGRVHNGNGDPVGNAKVDALKYTYQDGRRILVSLRTSGTNERGEYSLPRLIAGAYIVRATIGTDIPVYYPGTTEASSASPIELTPGIAFSGVDLTLSESRPMTVRGRVVNGLTGEPAPGAGVTLLPRRGNAAIGSLKRATVSSSGIFEFRDMAPGSYELVASGTTDDGRLAASQSIEIVRADIESVTLILQPQLSINGRISVENMQTGSLNLSNVRLQLRREPFIPELLIIQPAIAADGTFTLTGVTPGEYRLTVTPRAGYVKFARFGSIDALNPPFPVNGPGQLEILISPSTGALDAVIQFDATKKFPGATIVLVPDPPHRQRFDIYYAAAADDSGRVHLDTLAPGDYRVFAWDDVPADSWQDPDFLRSYEHLGKPARITEGGRASVELDLIEAR